MHEPSFLRRQRRFSAHHRIRHLGPSQNAVANSCCANGMKPGPQHCARIIPLRLLHRSLVCIMTRGQGETLRMPTISVRVDEASFKLVGKLATQLGRSKSWVVNDAIQAYLEHQRCMAVRTAKILDDLAMDGLTLFRTKQRLLSCKCAPPVTFPNDIVAYYRNYTHNANMKPQLPNLLTPTLRRRVDKIARRTGKPVTSLVRRALSTYLDHLERSITVATPARKAKAVGARKAVSTTTEDRRDLKRALASEKRARSSQPLNEVMREFGMGR